MNSNYLEDTKMRQVSKPKRRSNAPRNSGKKYNGGNKSKTVQKNYPLHSGSTKVSVPSPLEFMNNVENLTYEKLPQIDYSTKERNAGNGAPRIFNTELNIHEVLNYPEGSLFLYISPRGIMSKWKIEEGELRDFDTGKHFIEYLTATEYDFVYITRLSR